MAISLGRRLPAASCGVTGRVSGPPQSASTALLPMGFTRRLRLRRPGALLPHHFTLALHGFHRTGGMFLWHFPSGRPARPLAGIVALRSPDFPLPNAVSGGRQRPPGWLLVHYSTVYRRTAVASDSSTDIAGFIGSRLPGQSVG